MHTLQLKYSGIQVIIADYKKTICYNDIALKQGQTRQYLLKDFSYRFRTEDKTNSIYGIPEPVEQFLEVDIEKSKYNRAEQLDLFNNLCITIPNTNEQESIFEEITETIPLSGTGCLYFIQGIGGSGKSTLYEEILAWCRSQDKIVSTMCKCWYYNCIGEFQYSS